MQQHPSILPIDFDITSSGKLLINVPVDPVSDAVPSSGNQSDSSDQVAAPHTLTDLSTRGQRLSSREQPLSAPYSDYSPEDKEPPAYANTQFKPTPKVASSEQMVLTSDWVQVESILLINDGKGLGFGIVGGKSTGVIVKTLVCGGIADRVCCLLS